MISFQFRMLIARIKWFFCDKLLFEIAFLLPRKVALMAFIRVYSVLDSYGEDYENVYRLFEANKNQNV